MKITGLELFMVPPRRLFLKLSTDAGLAGPRLHRRLNLALERLLHYGDRRYRDRGRGPTADGQAIMT